MSLKMVCKCNNCGAKIKVDADRERFFCPYCGTEYIYENRKSFSDNLFSYLNGVGERRKETIRLKEEAKERAALRLEEEKKRIEKSERRWVIFAVIAFVIVGIYELGSGEDADEKNSVSNEETTIVSNDINYNDEEPIVEEPIKEAPSTKTQNSNNQVQVSFSLIDAKKAAYVAITNLCADDIFLSDGNTVDTSKLHSWSDKTGFHFDVLYLGDGRALDENTWELSKINLQVADTNTVVEDAWCKVTYDGENYVISKLHGKYYWPEFEETMSAGTTSIVYLTTLANEEKYQDTVLKVSPELLK